MTISRISAALLLSLTLGLAVTACQKEQGPAEKAGAKIDATASDIKAAATDAANGVEKAAEDAKEDLEH